MKKKVIILLFCSLSFFAKAQFMDSLQSTIDKKGTFAFSFTSRNSFINNSVADIFGFSIGVTFGKKLSIGGGYNFLSSDVQEIVNNEGQKDTGKINMAFFSYYIQYIINLTKHWKLYLTPINFGIGGSSIQYTVNKVLYTVDNNTVLLYEPSMELDYNFNRFFGLYTQVGYRLMLLNNPDFNSPTYSYGVLIYPLEIYAGLFPRTKLAHMIEDN